MRPGSVATADGGKAIRSSVAKAGDGSVPLAVAQHGRKPHKQFTSLKKINKQNGGVALEAVLRKQGRWDPKSSSVRIVGGNQAAEGTWGTGKMNLKQRCVHRGAAATRSTAHATCALFLSTFPGLAHFGQAWRRFFYEHMDQESPQVFFTRSGWSGAGANP